jgi:hypothetical protein
VCNRQTSGTLGATLGLVIVSYYSAEEISRAKEAREFCGKLGHPGAQSIKTALDHDLLGPTHLTSQDLVVAQELYGSCNACTMGKIREPDSPAQSWISE